MNVITKGIQISNPTAESLIEVKLTGKLDEEDYKVFGPELESMIRENGKLKMLVSFEDFHGWTAGGLWEDIKFDVKHFNDIERLAIVGDSKWEKGMAVFCKPFTTASVKFFPPERLDDARSWALSDG